MALWEQYCDPTAGFQLDGAFLPGLRLTTILPGPVLPSRINSVEFEHQASIVMCAQIERTGKSTTSSTCINSFCRKGSPYLTPIIWP